MTLRRKIIYQIGAMLVGLLVVSLSALYGLEGLRADFGVALGGYRELREVYDVGLHAATAKKALSAERPDAGLATNELDAALAKFDRFLAGPSESFSHTPEGSRLEAGLRASLREAAAGLSAGLDDAFVPGGNRLAPVDRAISQVAAIGAEIQRTITEREAAARSKWRATFVVVTSVSAAIVCGAVALGIYQYQSVITPLRRLGNAARNIATGHFGDRLHPHGPVEFAALAQDFNRMAAELSALYQNLEEQVAAKGKELARSERLASVGYLAAGVAHEINNPLSIITGFGERGLRHIELGEGEAMLASVEKCLRVMCEEAYRCKSITDQLLSLARHGHESRRQVPLLETVRQVQSAIDGIAEFRGRRIDVSSDLPGGDDAYVHASEGELKQVLLNLVINALEATSSAGGEVVVRLERDSDVSRLAVSDNGRGMTPATLERIFEPFYTEKRGAHRAGTGLGLSITHAIVRNLGGRLEAFSDGPGKGSRFVLQFPAEPTGGVS